MQINHYNGGIHGEKYGDKSFIDENIDLLPIRLQEETKNRYSEIYSQLEKEDPHHCRFRVNNWLRKMVNKYKAKIENGEAFF